MSFKEWERYSIGSLSEGCQDPRGRLFLSSLGQRNLSPVTLLHEGVDTVRQLYEGVLKPDVLEEIKRVYELGPAHRLIHVLGRDWLLGSGGASGFRYRLQDSDTGVILFVASRYSLESTQHSHLKIELSPHFIDGRDVKMIQGYMDVLAARLLIALKPSSCAVHLCVDVQGWEPPKNFADLLITRSRRRVEHRGISSVEFDLSELASVYGNGQSFLFGGAGGLQFSMYRKDLQARAVDKLDFWEGVWCRRTDEMFKPLYDESKPVWRFEFRFHQSVIEQFSEKNQEPLASFFELIPHLTGFFRYALANFRLNAVSSSASSNASFYRGVYIDPMWQLLMQDVDFKGPKSHFIYKRKQKKPGQGRLRNLWLAVGNLKSLYARKGFTAVQAVKCLIESGIWEEYCAYYRAKFEDLKYVSDSVLKGLILSDMDQALKERCLAGAAV